MITTKKQFDKKINHLIVSVPEAKTLIGETVEEMSEKIKIGFAKRIQYNSTYATCSKIANSFLR